MISAFCQYLVLKKVDWRQMEVIDKTVEAAVILGKILTFSCLQCYQHLLPSLALVHMVLHSQKHQGTA